MRSTGRIGSVGAAMAVAFVAACSSGETPMSAPSTAPDAFTTTDTWTAKVRLCKFGPAGTQATFHVSATGGTLVLGSDVTLDAVSDLSGCTVIWTPTDKSIVTVTATETGASDGMVIERIFTVGGLDGGQTFDNAGATASIRVDAYTGGYIKFENVPVVLPPPPPPPVLPATEGCTPGYWKQSQHFDSWPAAYTPDMAFDAVFADAFPGMSLLGVLKQGGGGLKALGRHTVAALLNAGNDDVQNGLSTDQVIAAFDAAFASGDYESQKDIFADLNELGCPLN